MKKIFMYFTITVLTTFVVNTKTAIAIEMPGLYLTEAADNCGGVGVAYRDAFIKRKGERRNLSLDEMFILFTTNKMPNDYQCGTNNSHIDNLEQYVLFNIQAFADALVKEGMIPSDYKITDPSALVKEYWHYVVLKPIIGPHWVYSVCKNDPMNLLLIKVYDDKLDDKSPIMGAYVGETLFTKATCTNVSSVAKPEGVPDLSDQGGSSQDNITNIITKKDTQTVVSGGGVTNIYINNTASVGDIDNHTEIKDNKVHADAKGGDAYVQGGPPTGQVIIMAQPQPYNNYQQGGFQQGGFQQGGFQQGGFQQGGNTYVNYRPFSNISLDLDLSHRDKCGRCGQSHSGSCSGGNYTPQPTQQTTVNQTIIGSHVPQQPGGYSPGGNQSDPGGYSPGGNQADNGQGVNGTTTGGYTPGGNNTGPYVDPNENSGGYTPGGNQGGKYIVTSNNVFTQLQGYTLRKN